MSQLYTFRICFPPIHLNACSSNPRWHVFGTTQTAYCSARTGHSRLLSNVIRHKKGGENNVRQKVYDIRYKASPSSDTFNDRNTSPHLLSIKYWFAECFFPKRADLVG